MQEKTATVFEQYRHFIHIESVQSPLIFIIRVVLQTVTSTEVTSHYEPPILPQPITWCGIWYVILHF